MSTEVAPPQIFARTGHAKLLVVGFLVALAVVATTWVVWTWRHPSVFNEPGNAVRQTMSGDDPIYFSVAFPDEDASGAVTINSVSPSLVETNDDTKIVFFVCTLTGGAGIGTVYERHMSDFCSSLEPAAGATMHLGGDSAQTLVMAVDQPGVGRVRIRDVAVTYSHGWQRGTQHTGPEVTVVRR